MARSALTLYSAALGLALLLAAPWWMRELRPGGKYREGLSERLGQIPSTRLQAPTGGQTVVWVHAVSVGEVLAVAPLIGQLRASLPQARVFVSTTTRTGQSIARARFGAYSVFYFPADFAFAVRAWLRFLQPSLVVLVESEFWPRFLFEANRARIPVAVVNARVSPRSWPRYYRLRGLWRPLVDTLALVHAQTMVDAARLRVLGARSTTVAGNLKYDLQPPRPTPLLLLLQQALSPEDKVIVCGSTLEHDEELLLRNVPPEPVLLLAPRHPKRFDEVAALLAKQARPWFRLSTWRHNPVRIPPQSILLLDSVGELAALYALATIAVIGGTFFNSGHNPLEAAVLGKPVVIGPAYSNFTEVVQTLKAAEAVVITELPDLVQHLKHLLLHPVEAEAMGKRAKQVCAQHAGATARVLAALLSLLQSGKETA